MIEFESSCDFVLVKKIFVSGILSSKKFEKKKENENEKWRRKKSTSCRIVVIITISGVMPQS